MTESISAAAILRIDQACDSFEAAWKAGRRPDPAAFLGPAAGEERATLLRQLLLRAANRLLAGGARRRAMPVRQSEQEAVVGAESRL